MGYFEYVCQLCGVSFAIGRIRRAEEPVSMTFGAISNLRPLIWTAVSEVLPSLGDLARNSMLTQGVSS